MRASLLVVLAGCGRLGFDDGASTIDAAPDAPDGIAAFVARYPMDDDPRGSGIVGSAQLPASCTSCPAPTPGVFGGAYEFDGSTTFFAIPSTSLIGLAPYSISVWIRVEQLPNPGFGRSVVNKALAQPAMQNAVNLVILDGPTIAQETSVTGALSDYNRSAIPLVLGAWHHVAATWNGTDKRIYVDGALGGLEPGVTAVDSNEPIRVGADFDVNMPVYFFGGAMDELRFYDRPLDETEVAALAKR